jgi:methylated-DNA-[protein]-cysteine S-methyltransferase
MPHISIHTPLGPLTLFEEADAIIALDWGEAPHGAPATPVLRNAADQLQDYFDGRRTRFDLPLAPRGTAFRQRVWDALCRIPHGETRSYADIAREIGCRAARAIGQANGANPIPILIPCHRVIGAGGALGGYSGGDGQATKRYLLQLERRASAARAGGSLLP